MKLRLFFSFVIAFLLIFTSKGVLAQHDNCGVKHEFIQSKITKNLRPKGLNNPSPFIGTNLSRGTHLRVLRLAVSCTGEFTQSVAGANDTEKKAEVLKQMKEWLVEINKTYGREYCIRFELIPDNLLLQLIYTNGATDPWPTMSGSGCDGSDLIHDIQPSVIDNAIGAANYDFSQVIIWNYNGGCAATGGADSYKKGYSAGFDLPITRHEIGHQFGQYHIVSNGGQNNYEPANAGRSIHGGNTDPFAHSYTFHQTALYLRDNFPNIGTDVPTGNTVPTVNAGADRAIPISTPFTLTGTANDPNQNNTLTYVWDQLDGAIEQSLPTTNDTEGALFSRLTPSRNPSRTYPNLGNVLANNFATTTEDLPTQARDLNFRLTVNDNNQFNYNGKIVNASGINSDDIKITVVNNGGPFQVTSQNSAISYLGASNQTITWSVNGTNGAPINVTNVKISLSFDGGVNFPIVLLESTPNDGSETVTLPNIDTNQARIKVEAIDNYFFAINGQNFIITGAFIPGIIVGASSGSTLVSEMGQTDTYVVGLRTPPSFGNVIINITADAQTEISQDGISFASNQSVFLTGASPVAVITVRGKFDNIPEGSHYGFIQHEVFSSADNTNYPPGMIGPPIVVNISDAQIPPIIGVDFDTPESTSTPDNWSKISDLTNASLSNLSYEDGSPTTIGLTTSATECGIGGCSFGIGTNILPVHVQSLDAMDGMAYARSLVTFTWSGLQANTGYRVFVFGKGFGFINQTITIAGSGTPITFVQKGDGSVVVNDQFGSIGELLINYGKIMTSSATGTITITVTSNLSSTEMSFAGIGIRKLDCLENLTLNTSPIPSNTYQAADQIQSAAMIESGSQVTFKAGSKISLNGQFRIQNGASFRGKIEGCQ